jgi:hypothetical protein
MRHLLNFHPHFKAVYQHFQAVHVIFRLLLSSLFKFDAEKVFGICQWH